MPYRDIQKRRECHKRYYLRNKDLYREKNIRRSKELIDFVISLKQKPCMDCGVQYPYYVMDFDHRERNDKIKEVAYMSARNWSLENIKKEADKCDLVCANCHRIRTFANMPR